MKKRTQYHQITAEPGKFSKPVILSGHAGIHKQACCDCGLVHDKKFTAWLKVPGGYQKLSSRAAVVMVQVRRNRDATRTRRKGKKYNHVRAALKNKPR